MGPVVLGCSVAIFKGFFRTQEFHRIFTGIGLFSHEKCRKHFKGDLKE
jgi:hypothetical protein